jgi:hypothetical protein
MEQLDMNVTRMSKEELERELHRIKLQLENAMSDLDKDEREVLQNLEFRHLPPYRDWPTRDDIIEPHRVALPPRLEDRRSERRPLIGREGIPTAGSRPKLDYRNTFTVSPSGHVR